MQDFSGGGATFKFSGVWVCREQRAILCGIWGHAPLQNNLKKWCNFMRFEGYFPPLS